MLGTGSGFEGMSENRHCRRSIARARACVPLFRLPSMQRPWFLPLAFAALIVQLFIVQPHIHALVANGLSAVPTSTAAIATPDRDQAITGPQAPHDPYPPGDDPSNCPLCQEVAHSAHFLSSAAAVLLLLLTVNVSPIVVWEVTPVVNAVSHTWRGRAPPQA